MVRASAVPHRAMTQKVFGVNGPDDVIDIVLINGNARMPTLNDELEQYR